MIIKTLVENLALSNNYKCKHGLSIYIETKLHKILFDLGPNNLFLENAIKLNVPIEDVDIVVISHAHYDHGGGLKTFMKNNKKAKIYINENAFEGYYGKTLGMKFYIGLDRTLKTSDRFVLTKGNIKIDGELQLFSGITGHRFYPDSNKILLVKTDKGYIQDSFDHEQHLLINENGTYTLFAGCAHRGIVNILEAAEKITGTEMKYVIGGYHMFQLNLKKTENINLLYEFSRVLSERKSLYYTCHCTGKNIFHILKNHMKEQMNYLSTGMVVELI